MKKRIIMKTSKANAIALAKTLNATKVALIPQYRGVYFEIPQGEKFLCGWFRGNRKVISDSRRRVYSSLTKKWRVLSQLEERLKRTSPK